MILFSGSPSLIYASVGLELNNHLNLLILYVGLDTSLLAFMLDPLYHHTAPTAIDLRKQLGTHTQNIASEIPSSSVSAAFSDTCHALRKSGFQSFTGHELAICTGNLPLPASLPGDRNCDIA